MTTNASPAPSDAGSLYVRALDATRRYVAGIRDGQWDAPTPCSEWNVRQLLNHVVYGTVWIEEIFNGKTIAEVGDRFDGDLLGSDPLSAYDAAVRSAKVSVGAPGAMEAICHLRRGDVSGSAYATSMFTDVFIHGWDVAKATGQDTALDADLVAACYAIMEPTRERRRASTAFSPETEVPEDANLQTKLLSLAGRQAS